MPNRESPSNEAHAPPKPLAVKEIPEGMDLINHVAQCLAMGCDPLDVRKQLMTFGFAEAAAEKYVADTQNWMRKNPQAGSSSAQALAKSRVNFNMLMGGFICIFGIVITIVTFSFASRIGGGTYIVAWGAILFGALQFLKGAAQSGRELEAEQSDNPQSQEDKS